MNKRKALFLLFKLIGNTEMYGNVLKYNDSPLFHFVEY